MPVAQGISQLKWTYFQQRPHRLAELQVFDDASRGPLGSLQLLWKIRWKAVVASLGALVCVLALATEPFTQQILSYPTLMTAMANVSAEIGSNRFLKSQELDAPLSLGRKLSDQRPV